MPLVNTPLDYHIALRNDPSVKRLYVRTNGTEETEPGDVEIVTRIAEPLVYQLDSITLNTIIGDNNIWADCGSTSVEYRADTKLYIQQLTKPTEDDMTANANIASGKFFMIGNRLFLSTASIASGATITTGTNCTELSLAEALNTINS